MREITNEDVSRYDKMVNRFIYKHVLGNFMEASMATSAENSSLGMTGMTIPDIRQDMYCEVVVALHKYDPNYRTKKGESVKESTFVYCHLWNRIGQLCKRITKKRYGYGCWNISIEKALHESGEEER